MQESTQVHEGSERKAVPLEQSEIYLGMGQSQVSGRASTWVMMHCQDQIAYLALALAMHEPGWAVVPPTSIAVVTISTNSANDIYSSAKSPVAIWLSCANTSAPQ